MVCPTFFPRNLLILARYLPCCKSGHRQQILVDNQQSTCPRISGFAIPRYYSRSRNNKIRGEDDISCNTTSYCNRDSTSPTRLLVIQPRLQPEMLLKAKLSEAVCLANSLEEQRDGYFVLDFFDKASPPHIVVQNPLARASGVHPGTYFGQGTLDTIKIQLDNIESKDNVDAVFVNCILSGIQQRNMERYWGRPVLDRVGLIIEIFNAHAHTKEAKLQAELAALTYKKSRLIRVHGPSGRMAFGSTGEAEVVSARGRGTGGMGFMSGAGETELQLQRRRILERRHHLLSQIENVRRTRALHRASRGKNSLRADGLATVAVVGYTNAGKSTLVSSLSESYLYSDSRLFATLDPRVRCVQLPSGRKVLLGDTVGFISDLPVQLVEAFHATLEEVTEADLLLHVIDCTAPNRDEHRETVLKLLQQIGVSEDKLRSMIEVWNKIDQEDLASGTEEYRTDGIVISDEEDDLGKANEAAEGYALAGGSGCGDAHGVDGNEVVLRSDYGPQHSPDAKVSALSGVGLKELLQLIDDRLRIHIEKNEPQAVERSIMNQKWRPPPAASPGF